MTNIVTKEALENMESDDPLLSRIHGKTNVKKFECYFIGFVDGILTNQRFDETELDPLLAECTAFSDNFGDDDANEVLLEASAGHVNTTQELFELLRCISEIRSQNIDPACPRSAANRILGFCAGVACDGIITFREAKELETVLSQKSEIADDPRVQALRHACRDAIADGVIENGEAAEIADWISRLVGDSYADTGLSSIGATPVVEDIDEILDDYFEHAPVVVLTGTFDHGSRKEVADFLSSFGANIVRNVSKKTQCIIIGEESSQNWKHAFMGDKISKALKLRADGNLPRIYREGQLRRFFKPLS